MRRKPGHRRRTSVKRIVLSLFLIMVVGVVGAGALAIWGLELIDAPGPLSEPTNVVVERGLPTTEIGDVLEREGVVADQRLFVLSAYLTRAARGGDLKAGEYAFPAGASLAQVLSILRSGRAVVHKITVPEGWTSAQVVERLNAEPALSGSVPEAPPEGSLLPDTYVFQRGVSRQALIERMQQAQTAYMDEVWPERAANLPFDAREDAIILASIVEKETAVADERRQIAGVFVNRLRRNMRLQSDPTIIYGITGGEGHLDRPLTQSDISGATPYNTYRIDGLPPTPIANPGRAAIAAVLRPDTSDELYFVADGSGGHAFAKTLREHNRNVRQWRTMERAAASDTTEDDTTGDAGAGAMDAAAEGDEAADAQGQDQPAGASGEAGTSDNDASDVPDAEAAADAGAADATMAEAGSDGADAANAGAADVAGAEAGDATAASTLPGDAVPARGDISSAPDERLAAAAPEPDAGGQTLDVATAEEPGAAPPDAAGSEQASLEPPPSTSPPTPQSRPQSDLQSDSQPDSRSGAEQILEPGREPTPWPRPRPKPPIPMLASERSSAPAQSPQTAPETASAEAVPLPRPKPQRN